MDARVRRIRPTSDRQPQQTHRQPVAAESIESATDPSRTGIQSVAADQPINLATTLARADRATRVRLVRDLQQRFGNRYVQSVTASSRQVIQRQSTTASPATAGQAAPQAGGAGAHFGPYAPETFAQLLNISRTLVQDLREQLQDVPADAPVQAEAQQWIQGVEAWEPILEEEGTNPINQLAASQASAWYDQLVQIRKNVQTYKQDEIVRNLNRAQAALASAAAGIEAHRPELDEALRQAFLQQDDDAIGQVSSFVGGALDIGLSLNDLSRQMAEAIADARGAAIPAASRYTGWLTNLNKFLAAANTLWAVAHLDAPTELGRAANQINLVTGAFSAGGTLLGLAAPVGLYCDLYLVPLTQVILSRLTALLDHHLHELNVVAAATGFSVEMSNEPGGWPMYNFLVQVMRADSPEGVPSPIPSPVESYLLDQRAHFEAGTHDEMPTTGFWFWRHVASGRIQDWVFQHRQDVWRMLYGSMQVPSANATPGRP